MTPKAQPAAEIAGLLREYDIGRLVAAQPLTGGSVAVLRVRADHGSFVLKPAPRLADIELQARAARYLTDRGIRQARIVPTRTGALVSSDGHYLQEFLPGTIVARPSAYQAAATMRHVGAYHRELASMPGSYQPDGGSLWRHVTDPEYLVRELPDLMARHRLADEDALAAVDALDRARSRLAELPRQVAHGDIGPDNVLMDGDEVVSLVDFTPYWEPVLFAACTALYWYDVYGQPVVDVGRLGASMAMIGEGWPWTEAEKALWPAGLLREALRRLATPLALAAESGDRPGPSLAARHAALLAIVRALPQ